MANTEIEEAEETAEPVDLAAGHPPERVDGPEARKRGAKLRGKTILPKPKHGFSVNGDKSIGFFKWWQDFDADQAGRCEIHTYREWPIIDQALVGNHKQKMIEKFEGVIPFEASEYETEFLHRFGSGKYKLICTEKGVPGGIAMCKFSVEDAAYPPRVDPKTIVQGHPENQGYLAGLRARGERLPGDGPTREEEDEDMNAGIGEALQAQSETIVSLAKEVSAARSQPQPQPTTQPSLETRAAEKVIDMVVNHAKQVTEESSKSYDPVAMMTSVADMFSKFQKPDNSLSQFAEIFRENMKAINDANERHMNAQKEERDFWRNMALKKEEPSITDKPRDLIGQLKELGENKDVLLSLLGRNPRSEVSSAPSWMDKIGEAFAANPQAAIGIVSSVVGLVVQGVQSILKPAPAPIPAQPQFQPAPAPQPAPPTPEENAKAEQQKVFDAFMARIEKSFLVCFGETEAPGYAFAEAFLSEFTPNGNETTDGRLQYNELLATSGPAGPRIQMGNMQVTRFDAMCRSYFPIWSKVQGMLPHYAKLLEQFYSYDEYMKQESGPVGVPKKTAAKAN